MKVLSLITAVIVLTLPLISGAKEIDLSIPLQPQERLQFTAKQGVFSVAGWNQEFVKLKGIASETIHYEREDSELAITLNSTAPQTVPDNLAIKVPHGTEIGFTAHDASLSFEGLKAGLIGSTESGDIQISNFSSELAVTSVNGNVRLRNSSGEFNIDTVNGDIEITDATGIANIRSISGDQYVEADLRNVTTSNVSGNSLYKLNTLEKLNLSNVNGDSRVESAISKAADIQMSSVKGHLSLLVPADTSARFSIQSHNGGKLSNSLGGDTEPTNNSNSAQTFNLAGASASVAMNTMEGNIDVGPQTNGLPNYDDGNFDWSSVDTSILDFAYINPNQSVFDYQKVFIKTPEIHFDQRWLEKFDEDETRSYRARVVSEYADLLKKAIADRLSRSTGLRLSEERGDDVLVVIPKVVDLYIDHPDLVGIRDVFVTTPAGNAQLDLVIYSPKSQSVLGLILDKRSTAKPGIAQTSRLRTMNSRAFTQLFKDWIANVARVLNKQAADK